jgi:hypothetical protein
VFFPVIDKDVALNTMALNYVAASDVSVKETEKLNSRYRSQIKTEQVSTMNTDDFVAVIPSF